MSPERDRMTKEQVSILYPALSAGSPVCRRVLSFEGNMLWLSNHHPALVQPVSGLREMNKRDTVYG